MTFAQAILKLMHPESERLRTELRESIARASAEADDALKTVSFKSEEFRHFLGSCPCEADPCKKQSR